MKKIVHFFIVFLFIAATSKAQYVTIPDANFKAYLISKYPACFNGAGQMDTTCSAIVNETALMANNTNFSNIEGIQYFDNLNFLNCAYNNITSISKLPPNLISLICNNNLLSTLPVLPLGLKKLDCSQAHGFFGIFTLPDLSAGLTYLNCDYNNISALPALPATMDTLECYQCNLTNLPVLPSNLVWLHCLKNPIHTIPNLPNTLKDFEIGSSFITSIPTLPSGLFSFALSDCPNLPVDSIVLPSTLSGFKCLNCNYSSLPNLPSTLYSLILQRNNLTSLPVLPPNLVGLDITSNKISTLPALPNSLRDLRCGDNPGLVCLPKLPYLFLLMLDTAKIKCLPNSSVNMKVYQDGNSNQITLPICNATYNPNQCEAFPTVIGKIFYDNNSNGVKDANEPYKIFSEIVTSTGDYSFTDNTGSYAITFNNIGTYSLNFSASGFYNAVPSTQSITFNSFDSTIVLPDIALQPISTVDSLSVVATPLYGEARPGWGFPYLVGYSNVGTTTLSPDIKLIYDNNHLIYDSCNTPLVINSGTDLNLTYPNMSAGQSGYFVGYFDVKTTATLGDTIRAIASINCPTTTTVFDAPYTIITGSFDPNDKDATPELTPAQVAVGKPIDYTIRFQNTGTASAINIVVADTLSSLLQANTLELVSSSHNCKTTVKGNAVTFEFLKINLPDSNHDKLKSHGFIRFKIKPKSNLTAGTNINNRAAIYFDYNSPVITNTATTKIKNPIIVPLKLLSFNGNALENGNNLLYWNTANEINTQSFIIQQSMDGRVFASVGEVKAKGSGEYRFTDNRSPITAYYRLMIKDNDGSFTFSKIIVIKSNTESSNFKILNNPVKNELVISSISNSLMNTEASLINCNGIVVKRFELNASAQTINVSSLSNGIYYLRTVEGNRKVVVSR